MQVIIRKIQKENDLPLNGLRMRGSRKFCQRGPNFNFLFFLIYFFMRVGRIQIPLLAGHQRPASESHSNGVSLAGRWWPNTECWLVSFMVLTGDPD